MDDPYHVTVFDNFHPYDPDEAWVIGTFATPEAAIEAVKHRVDRELKYLWSEVCHQDKGISTLDRLVSHYKSFAENPIAFGPDCRSIFDSTAYMTARAAEMLKEEPASYIGHVPPVHPPAPPSQSQNPAQSIIGSRERRSPRLAKIKAILDWPPRIVVRLVAIVLVVAVCWLIFHWS